MRRGAGQQSGTARRAACRPSRAPYPAAPRRSLSSIDLIAETAGTTKKTLYDRFGSKDALIALYLQRRAERWQAFVLDHLAEHAPKPGVDRVIAVLDALDAWMTIHQRGCAFVNAQAEITDPQHEAVAVIRAEKQWVRDRYEQLVREAGFHSSAVLARQLMLVHEGAIVERSVGNQPDALNVARSAARALLTAGALRPAGRGRKPGPGRP